MTTASRRSKRAAAEPAKRSSKLRSLPKVASGIDGFDEITGGGLPRGRITLICGAAGCGKTLFSVQFLVNGAIEHGEPGVCMLFEETSEELARNVASLGYDLDDLQARKLLAIDHVLIDRSEIEETGEYDLSGLFVRIASAIDSVKAKRVVLDTIEALFAGLSNQGILRSELRRLFAWLKNRGITAVITGERGERTLTRYGLEEYVSDCVIVLDHRVDHQVATRLLQVVKYRGSAHGSNEYPFLIDEGGFSVLPITSHALSYEVSDERVSTGLPALDDMMVGGGYYRGSSVLIAGTAGTGKTSLAALAADASCRRGERAIYFALEESGHQIVRNMRSIGVDLEPWVKKGLLDIRAARPTLYGLEMHLVTLHRAIEETSPATVILDPVSSFAAVGSAHEVKTMYVRLLDYLKMRGITTVLTCLSDVAGMEATMIGISSLIDTWLQLRDIEVGGERTRGLYVVKSRGMGHSNQVREFFIRSDGISLVPVVVGPEGVVTGAARVSVESRARDAAKLDLQLRASRRRVLERKREMMDAQIELMRAQLSAEEKDSQELDDLPPSPSANGGRKKATRRT